MGERSLTYDEVNKEADQIAHAIFRKHGPTNESVALLFDHTVEAIAATLGVMKAEKFYIVLDLKFPWPHLALLIENSAAQVVLTDRRNRSLGRTLAVDHRVGFIWQNRRAQSCKHGRSSEAKGDGLRARRSSNRFGIRTLQEFLLRSNYWIVSNDELREAIKG